MKVLAVDDNPMAGIILGDVLKDMGYKACVAQNAEDALKLFESEEPDLCILDWMMPGVDGLQLACAIRKHRRGAGVYIMMLSSKQDLDSIGLAYDLGVDDFINKPAASGELKARLHVAARLVELRAAHARKCEEVAALASELDQMRTAA